MSDLELHPLCTLFPRMSGAEFDALKADILAHGLREAITVHDGFVLDGGNRYRACVEAGVEPTLKEFTGDNPVSFVLSANLHRRHLTQGQQATIVASAQDWSKAQSHGGNRQAASLPLATVADRATQSGASDRTQRMADKVVKGDSELARQVREGEISLPKAVKQLSPRQPAQAQKNDANDDAPDFDVDETAAPGPANAPADPPLLSLDDLDTPPDTEELLAAEQAEVARLEGEVLTLKARVDLLESGDLVAQMIALEKDRDGYRNTSLDHFNKWTTANKKVIDYEKLLNKLRKIAGVAKYGDLAGRITPAEAV